MFILTGQSKKTILSVLICCTSFMAFSQNIVDTAARPQVFAHGVASTPYDEWATSFTPDGRTVFFSQGGLYWTICFSKMVAGKWSRPNVISFSGKWNDTDPFVSPDGKRMFFISNRPVDTASDKNKYNKNYHIWYADCLAGDNWSAPHHLDAPVNINGSNNYAPSVSRSGTLCFCSRGRDGHDGMASYSAKWLGDHYDTPQLFTLNGKEDSRTPSSPPMKAT
ncbi:MAG: translocation protein TolB [Mucilaginibacter sp.]|nr:translocation protein TolB [Mucilaginibacter sp.]